MSPRNLSLLAALLCGTLFATSALAVRTEYIAGFRGQRLAGSQVCFFPATADDGFFQKFLSSSDVRCLSADVVLDMPVGNWNAFVETGEAYVSTHPTFQTGDSESEAARRGYRPVHVEMRPAAVVTVDPGSLEAGVRPVIYLPNAGTEEPASIRPLVSGRSHFVVPAGVPIVPLLVRGTQIVRVGDVMTLDAGARARASFPAPAEGRRDVVVLVRLQGDLEEEQFDPDDEMDVYLRHGASKLLPAVAPRTGLGLDRSLLIFRGAPKGEGTLVISGRRWAAREIAVPSVPDGAQAWQTTVHLFRHAEIEVHWSVAAEAVRTEPCHSQPPEADTAQREAELRVERCENAQTCELVRTIALDDAETEGTARAGDLVPGSYRVTLRHRRFGTASRNVEAIRGQSASTTMVIEPVTVRGSVTVRGRGIPADVAFSTGTATADSNGQYVAYLSRPPGLETVHVQPCDGTGEYVVVPPEPLADGSIYDIAISQTTVLLRVSDAQNGDAVEGAVVTAPTLFDRDGDEWFFLDTKATNGDGESELARVPPDVWLRVCASHRDFAARCSDPMKLAADERKEVKLALAKREAFRGRLLSGAPIAGGRLIWIDPAGAITEMLPVQSDGRFVYTKTHSPMEHAVFVAVSHPLQVLRATRPNEQGEMEIPVLPMPGRSVVLTPQGLENARLALEIDGLLVPSDVLGMHQSYRREDSSIQGGRPLSIRDVAGRDVVVLVGPPTNVLPPGAPPGDLSTVPEFRALFRRYAVTRPSLEIR